MRLLALGLWALFGLPDSSGRRSERLGNSYSFLRQEADRGLDVEVWHNRTLDRDEIWHKPSPQACFVRVAKDLYVLGVHEAGQWQTRPGVRMIFREGEWTTVRRR